MLVFRESSGRSLGRAPFVRRARRRGGDSNGSPTGRSGISNDRPAGHRDLRRRMTPARRGTSGHPGPDPGDPSAGGSSLIGTHRRYIVTCAPRAIRDRLFKKVAKSFANATRRHSSGVGQRPSGGDASQALSSRLRPPSFRRAGAARLCHGARGSEGNARSSRSNSASPTLRPRIVISAATATSRVSSSPRSVVNR